MNYLKSYQTFESVDSLREEVKELLANLEDDGFIVTFSYMGKDNGYIYIKKPLSDKKQEQFFRADEVRGDIVRMCEFLGDRYLCDINIVGAGSMLRAKPVTLYQFEKMESKIYTIKINLFSTKDDLK
jgi:hypothetical protein